MAGPAAGCCRLDLRFVQKSRLVDAPGSGHKARTDSDLPRPCILQIGHSGGCAMQIWKLWNILNNQSYYPPCLSLPGPDIDTVRCNLLTDKMGRDGLDIGVKVVCPIKIF